MLINRAPGRVDVELLGHGRGRAAARRISSVLALGAVACAALGGLGAARALAAGPDTPYDVSKIAAPDPQLGGRFGDRMVRAGDLNHDGVEDFWVADYRQGFAGLASAGAVYAISGKDRSVLYRIDTPEPQATMNFFGGFGFRITNLGDVNGDGVDDLAVGSVTHNVNAITGEGCQAGEPNCNVGQGKAWVFDGATGKLLYALNNPVPQANGGFGNVGTAGDINGDGVSDVVVGAYLNDVTVDGSNNVIPGGAGCGNTTPIPANCRKDQGQAFIFNGKTGALLRTLNLPPSDVQPASCNTAVEPSPPGTPCGNFGIITQGPGDVNGDGVPDQYISAWTYNYDTTSAPPGAPCSVGAAGCNAAQGRIYLFSGRDGTLIRHVDDPEPQAGALFGLQLVEAGAPGDVNRDGHADLYGMGFLQNGPAGPGEGKSWVFDGASGRVLYALNDPTPEAGGQFGYSLSRTDYDHDGDPDLYVGASPHHVIGTTQSGGTKVFDGQDGHLLKILNLPASDVQPGTATDQGPELGTSVVALGDVNGDGEPDFVAGAPGIDSMFQDEGRVYVFLSRAAPPNVTNYGVTNKAFLVGRRSTPRVGGAARAPKHKTGTTFKYTLSDAATVEIVIAQRVGGRHKGKQCVAPTPKLRRAKRCIRSVLRGILTRASHAGVNSVAFSGRIGTNALKPGSYSATLTARRPGATNSAEHISKPITILFTILGG